ncbi:hypothetical protein ACFPYI_10225 [Halomarina salina]|uniref:Uncharacterized protein n=1 Tax=Halomarina salina TaxID=1872699 RepID=A0ABD5RMR7_9EURY|nr:hypothetical protein [Halomarina salina]
MQVQNRWGRSVDPVPFLVTAGVAGLVSYSFVPPYCLSFGLDLELGLALATLLFVGGSALTYHRLVWAARPDLRREIPPDQRLRSLVYGVLVVVGLFALVSLPFYVG